MAKGSHATRGTYPKHCAGCNQPVRVTKDHCWYETTIGKGGHPIDRSWHAHCHPQPNVR